MVVHENGNEKGKWHVFPYSENLIQCVAIFFFFGGGGGGSILASISDNDV